MAVTADDDRHEGETADPSRLVVVSGCSGGGKSTLLEEMARRGFEVRPEAGREIVRRQLRSGGRALPWEDPRRFVELAVLLAARHYRSAANRHGPVLFDRSVVDLVSYLDFKGLETPRRFKHLMASCRYAPFVFMTPPWREIYQSDTERPKSFEEAVREYDNLVARYQDLGYRVVDLPKVGLGERADFLQNRLAGIAADPRER